MNEIVAVAYELTLKNIIPKYLDFSFQNLLNKSQSFNYRHLVPQILKCDDLKLLKRTEFIMPYPPFALRSFRQSTSPSPHTHLLCICVCSLVSAVDWIKDY